MDKKQTTESVTLNSAPTGGREEFKGLLIRGTGNRGVAVVLLHGRKSSSDAAVVGPLRRSLGELGYTTLSIQNPVPKATDEFPDYLEDLKGKNYVFPEAHARVRAALTYLKQAGAKEAILLGFSMGARMHSAFLAQNEATEIPVRGLIALSNGVNGIPPLDSTASLSKVKVPILDISGEGDPDVAKSAERRKAAYEGAGGKAFTDIVIKGAVPHDFSGHEEELQKHVHSWITAVAPANA